MRQSVNNKYIGIRWRFMMNLDDLEFADHIALLSSRFNDMQEKTNKINETAEKQQG